MLALLLTCGQPQISHGGAPPTIDLIVVAALVADIALRFKR